MDLRTTLLPAAIAAVLTVSPVAAHADDLVVGFKRPVGPAAERHLADDAGARILRRLGPLRAVRVVVPRARRASALNRLRADPRVAFADADTRIQVRNDVGPPIAGIARTPNDKGFSYQQALAQSNDHDIDATDAWTHHTSCAKVAVVDSGVDTSHPDLKANLWHNPREIPGNGIDDDHNGYVDDAVGVDLLRGRGSGIDHNGHGTIVAGIIGAHGNNRRGIAGVCWRVPIVPVRILDADGRGSTSTSAEGIMYAVAIGAKIINASYSTDTVTDIERRAVAYARDHGALVVAAAGNQGRDADRRPAYPAAFLETNVVSVAATDAHDRLAPFSNFGPLTVDLAAPGESIASTALGGGYRQASGTSMAAPLASAAAAMLRAVAHPPLLRLRADLLESVDHVGGLRAKTATGGRLNLDRALKLAGAHPRR